MNHFAHLVLSQPTVESTVGNLLGDFARGIEPQNLSAAVFAGFMNHRAVDKFTDSHPLIEEMKSAFSAQRRRFAGIALDIYFDHLLINHWDSFEQRNQQQLVNQFYQRMRQGQALMPGENMQRVTTRMIRYDWFGSYRDIDSIAEVMDRVAARIRFKNQFANAIEDIERNQEMIGDRFFEFYPQLQAHISELAIES